jgi:pimeloyl-ACP methyl ester carboxylesterase
MPILFTHGATMDHGMFDGQVEHFASRRRVITWDVPGHGKSRPYHDFSLRNAASDLLSVLHAEGIDKAHLVGQSMGGYIAQIAASDEPDRVLSLCAVDSSPVKISFYSVLDRWLLSITPAILKLYPYRTLIATISKRISLSPAGQEYALRTLKTLSKDEIAAIMGEVYGGLIEDGKEDIRLSCPMLLVIGERDKTGKVTPYCRRWAQADGYPLRTIPQAAHNANVDNPGAFNRVLREFLAEVGGC